MQQDREGSYFSRAAVRCSRAVIRPGNASTEDRRGVSVGAVYFKAAGGACFGTSNALARMPTRNVTWSEMILNSTH